MCALGVYVAGHVTAVHNKRSFETGFRCKQPGIKPGIGQVNYAIHIGASQVQGNFDSLPPQVQTPKRLIGEYGIGPGIIMNSLQYVVLAKHVIR
jgi:hypothetical protein